MNDAERRNPSEMTPAELGNWLAPALEAPNRISDEELMRIIEEGARQREELGLAGSDQ